MEKIKHKTQGDSQMTKTTEIKPDAKPKKLTIRELEMILRGENDWCDLPDASDEEVLDSEPKKA